MNLSDNFIIEEIDDGLIILNFETGRYLETNELGKFIIQMLIKQSPIRDIVDMIAENKSAEKSLIEKDVSDFLSDLEKLKILKND